MWLRFSQMSIYLSTIHTLECEPEPDGGLVHTSSFNSVVRWRHRRAQHYNADYRHLLCLQGVCGE